MNTILAIDDTQDNLIVIKALLKNLMPETIVLSAQSGRHGLEIAEQEEPDVILLDLVMPGMDGYETCRRLKTTERTQHIPVIMLTALSTDSASRTKSLNLGADAFLAKPIEETELIAQLRAMLRIRQAEDLLREEKNVLEGLVQERTHALQKELSERKRMEQEREILIDELQTKNSELERFTYTVSHDLKSPLITIKGFLGMLEKDALSGDTELMRADMGFISDAVLKMQQLLDGLLELSRIGRMMNSPEGISGAELVAAALRAVGGRLRESGVELKIADNLPVLHGDRLRLEEVFENLIDNAVKFTAQQPDAQIEIGIRETQDEQVVYVKDNGLGIDPAYHEKIFGLFTQLDQHKEGTGIGLSIVKRIIEVHGGRIWVESEGVGQGACFCFSLGEHSQIE